MRAARSGQWGVEVTTDATDFAPVLPRLATPALTPRPEPVMPPVPESGAVAESVSQAVAPGVTEALPTQAPTARRSGRSPGRVVLGALARAAIAVMVVAAGVVPVLLARHVVGPATLDPNGESMQLPRFDVAPPAYGTAQFVFEYTGTDATRYQLLANGDASVLYFTNLDTTGALAGMLAAATQDGTFTLYPGESVWSLSSSIDWTGWQLERQLGRVLTFANVVPDELRRFVTVAETRSTQLAGRDVTFYELLIKTDDAAQDEPDAYDDYLFNDGTTASAGIRVAVFVDEAGVVWQLETWGDAAPSDRLVVTLQSFAPTEFTPQFPLQYYDETNGGVLVGG
jgi:hypothetical protein